MEEAELFSPAETVSEKIAQMLGAILLLFAVMGIILFLASRAAGRHSDRVVGRLYLAPAMVMLAIGLLYPAALTIYQSFFNAAGGAFVGINNYRQIVTDPGQVTILFNTFLWVVVTPFFATAVGLLYALLVDKARLESAAKSLIFLPMAISFVGASIIWRFVYEYRPNQPGVKQIGLLNQILIWLGDTPRQWLIEHPLNTFMLIFVMIWIQAGFAMTVLSAAIKAIPNDIVEAARLDGVTTFGMFRFVTLPSIRPTVVVVLTTIAIATLKVFDIIRTMTGGRFDTSVIANEFYSQSFRSDNQGLGSALAVVLFILVIPIVVYNVRQLRASGSQ